MTLILISVLVLLSGCLHEIRIIPVCHGTPSVMPCVGPCKVRVPAPVPTELLIPNALVIRDHTGTVRCQEVDG